MFVFKDMLNVVLLLQFVVNGQQEACNDGDFRQQQEEDNNGIFIQFCSGGSWHYLCSGGVGWTPTLATVACRQLGYSEQGAKASLTLHCDGLPGRMPKLFRTNQICTGMENNLTECGGVQVNQMCPCGQVAVIMCKLAVNVTQSPTTAATSGSDTSSSMDNVHVPSPTTTSNTNTDSVSPTTTSQDDNTTSINNTALGAVIGVLVALVAVVLITVVCIVVVYMCKKSHQLEGPTCTMKRNESYTFTQLDVQVYDDASSTQPTLTNNNHQLKSTSTKENESYSVKQLDDQVYDDASSTQPNLKNNIHQPATNKNESYSLRQLDDPVYDDASSTQPNYSLDCDMEAVYNPGTNGYDFIKCTNKHDDEQHPLEVTDAKEKKNTDAGKRPNEVIKANKKKKAEKKSDKKNKPKSSAREIPANPTPVRDDDSKKEEDFYDAEEHVYSVVTKSKKKANKKPSENGERQREEDY